MPTTLFHYGQHWFAWNKVVEAIRSPIAQDPYGRVYYTDGEYPKVTHAQIATGGSNKPTAWYRLGIPAPGVPVGVGTITPPVGGVDDDLTDDETRFYVDTFVTAMGEGAPGPVSGKVNIGIPGSSVTLMLSPPTTRTVTSPSAGYIGRCPVAAWRLPAGRRAAHCPKHRLSIPAPMGSWAPCWRLTITPCRRTACAACVKWRTACAPALLATPSTCASLTFPMPGRRSTG